MEIKGRVCAILAPQSGQGKKGTWKKQEFVIETEGQYPKKVCLALWGDKQCPPMGSLVTASIEIESREYKSKWYTEVRAWKHEVQPGNTGQRQQQQSPQQTEAETGFKVDDISIDDIPF